MDFLTPKEDESALQINYPGVSHFLNCSYVKNLNFNPLQLESLEQIIQAIVTLGAPDFFNERNMQNLTRQVSDYEPVIGLLGLLSCRRESARLSKIFLEKLLFDDYSKQTLLEILHIIRFNNRNAVVSNNTILKLISKKNDLQQLAKLMHTILLRIPVLLSESNLELLIDYPYGYQSLVNFYKILLNPRWFDSYYASLLELFGTESFFIRLIDKGENLAPVVSVITTYLQSQRFRAEDQNLSYFNKATFLALLNMKTDRDEWALACQVFASKSTEPLRLAIVCHLATLSAARLNDVVQAVIYLTSYYHFDLNDDLQELLSQQEGFAATLILKMALHQRQSIDSSQAYLTRPILNLLKCKSAADLNILCHILQKSYDKNLHISSYFFRELLSFQGQRLSAYEKQIEKTQEQLYPECLLYERACRISPPIALVTFIKTYRMHQLKEKVISDVVSEEIAQVIARASDKKIINLCEKMAQQLLPITNTDIVFRFLQFQAWLHLKCSLSEESKRKGYQHWSLLKKIEERAAARPASDRLLTQGQWVDLILSLAYQILRNYDRQRYYWPILSERRLYLVAHSASTESLIIAEQVAQDFHHRASFFSDAQLHDSPRFRLGVTTFLTEKELSDMRKTECRPGRHVHFGALPSIEKDASFDSGIFYSRRASEQTVYPRPQETQPILEDIIQKKPEF